MFDDVMEFCFWEAAADMAEALELLDHVRDNKREQPIDPATQAEIDRFRSWKD